MRAKQYSLESGFLAFSHSEGTLVNNIVLFVCGLAVAMMSGMGILVYMVHLGYKEKEAEITEKEKNNLMIKEKLGSDLGVMSESIDPSSSLDSFVDIPSVS